MELALSAIKAFWCRIFIKPRAITMNYCRCLAQRHATRRCRISVMGRTLYSAHNSSFSRQRKRAAHRTTRPDCSIWHLPSKVAWLHETLMNMRYRGTRRFCMLHGSFLNMAHSMRLTSSIHLHKVRGCPSHRRCRLALTSSKVDIGEDAANGCFVRTSVNQKL